MFKARDVNRALVDKGFGEDKKRDHCYYFFYHKGKKSHFFTKISHNETDISDGLCSAMARQVKLTKLQFKEFVACLLTEEATRRSSSTPTT